MEELFISIKEDSMRFIPLNYNNFGGYFCFPNLEIRHSPQHGCWKCGVNWTEWGRQWTLVHSNSDQRSEQLRFWRLPNFLMKSNQMQSILRENLQKSFVTNELRVLAKGEKYIRNSINWTKSIFENYSPTQKPTSINTHTNGCQNSKFNWLTPNSE